ncbi:thiol-disulfide oxidoreductase ResA [Paenibacillus illinoisensis]|uniref:redoxin domain-containing protein n=1 Tax=Paenibacillus illinoisensis TaxID=59845 RepID=UPI0034AD6F94
MGKSRRTVQIVILLLILVLGGYAITTSVSGSNGKPKEGDKAPSFELLGLDDQVHTSEEYEGKAMVINFWGTWCEPCVKEMPALQAQADKWKDQGVQFIGINAGEDQMTVDNFVRQVGVNFPIMLDRDKTSIRDFGISPMPTTFFVSNTGKISTIHIGQLDLDTLDAQISQLAKQP